MPVLAVLGGVLYLLLLYLVCAALFAGLSRAIEAFEKNPGQTVLVGIACLVGLGWLYNNGCRL